MSIENSAKNESTFWLPVCCSHVMRHSVFGSHQGKAAAAILVCNSCGKHIMLQPEPIDSAQDASGQLISLLATPKSWQVATVASGVESGDDELGEETIA